VMLSNADLATNCRDPTQQCFSRSGVVAKWPRASTISKCLNGGKPRNISNRIVHSALEYVKIAFLPSRAELDAKHDERNRDGEKQAMMIGYLLHGTTTRKKTRTTSKQISEIKNSFQAKQGLSMRAEHMLARSMYDVSFGRMPAL
jgi:hypothetical protein